MKKRYMLWILLVVINVILLVACVTPIWEMAFGNVVLGAFIGNFMTLNALVGVALLALGIVLLVVRALLLKHYAKKHAQMA